MKHKEKRLEYVRQYQSFFGTLSDHHGGEVYCKSATQRFIYTGVIFFLTLAQNLKKNIPALQENYRKFLPITKQYRNNKKSKD